MDDVTSHRPVTTLGRRDLMKLGAGVVVTTLNAQTGSAQTSPPAHVPLFCRTATTFSKSGGLDEDALRVFLQRFIDAKHAIYLGSGGSGEGHNLTRDELRRVYQIGLAECKGKIPVYANPPEEYSARETIEQTQLAIDCGVEVVNIYGLAGLHSMRPTPYELQAYYDEVLGAIKHPVALAAQPLVGYSVKASLIASLCNKYSQVVAVNLTGVSDTYFIQVKDMLKRKVDLYVPIQGSDHTLNLGATGLLATESNILPKTYRRYLDCYSQKNYAEMSRVYADINRFLEYVSPWGQGPTRWIKMAMKVLKLPGGDGGMREPYRMPPADELARFTQGLLQLGVPEIDEQARAAGVKV